MAGFHCILYHYKLGLPGASSKFLLLFLRKTLPRARKGRGERDIRLSFFLFKTSLYNSWNTSATLGYPSDAEHSTNMHLKISANEYPSVFDTCRSCSRSDLFPTIITTIFCLNGMRRLCKSRTSSKLFRSVIEYTSTRPSAQSVRLSNELSPVDWK